MDRLELEAIAAVVIAIAACIGLYFYDDHEQALGAQGTQLAAEKQHTLDVAAASAKDAKIATDQKAADHEADVFNLAAKLDASAASSAGDRLQHRFAAINAGCLSGDPAASAPGAPTSDASGMRSDVLRRIVAAARLAASVADAAHGAGLNAERDYDALKP